MSVGLVWYFWQYNYDADSSDEKWIYPFVWSIPCFSLVVGLFSLAASHRRMSRMLCGVKKREFCFVIFK
jgi:hypothetical protein